MIFVDKQIDIIIRIKKIDEELELELIDFGVIDLSKSEDEISITAKFENFGSIQKELERRGFEIKSSEFEREAITLKDLKEEERVKVEKLLALVDEDEDVQNVYHNMKSQN